MSTENDFSLLRPFDLEAAKRGEKLVRITAGALTDVVLAALSGPDGDHAVRKDDGDLIWGKAENLRMAPLCWVEGRPVYKGDVLWHNRRGRIVADRMSDCGQFLCEKIYSSSGDRIENLTWTPPKVKRTGWVLLVKDSGVTMVRNGKIYDDKDKAERVMDKLNGIEAIVGCFPFDYEEPASQEGGA